MKYKYIDYFFLAPLPLPPFPLEITFFSLTLSFASDSGFTDFLTVTFTSPIIVAFSLLSSCATNGAKVVGSSSFLLTYSSYSFLLTTSSSLTVDTTSST